ncbi:MAG: DUF4038 domain-containing protein [Thiotrichales bacterium]
MLATVAAVTAVTTGSAIAGDAASFAVTPREVLVHPDKRFLMYADGSPFFWLSDTQWELIHKSTREQADEVLTDRATKGFTAIQMPLLFHWSIATSNKYGYYPGSPGNWELGAHLPQDAFWNHADYVVDKTIALGMHPVIFPAWGNLSGGEDNAFTTQQAREYGAWVANRYKNRPGVIFVVGGDRNPGQDCCGITPAIAEGIKSVSPERLVSFHSWYNERGEGYANASWINFSTFQTGHWNCNDSNEYRNVTDVIMEDWNATPTRPVINMEPRYENMGDCSPAFDDYQTRVTAYWSVFAGSFGIGYGESPLWYWDQWGANQPNFNFNIIRQHLAKPFSGQAQHLKNLMLSRPFFGRVPAPSLAGNATGVGATRGDGYIMVYAAPGQSVTVNTASLAGKTVRQWWFGPKDGSVRNMGTFSGGGWVQFNPPSTGRGNDWVLVLDDNARGFPPPGTPLTDDTDSDGDGIPDRLDNCSSIANADQRDSDGDGYGNACDADLNNDGIVNGLDLVLFRQRFLTNDPHADFNGDGVVNGLDLVRFRQMFLSPPGPSGILAD